MALNFSGIEHIQADISGGWDASVGQAGLASFAQLRAVGGH